MMKNIAPCLEQHLPDKARPDNKVGEDAWFDAAALHLKSARIVNETDPSGSLLLAWASMHKTAKGVAALVGARLEAETHGKIVDFLCCVFEDLTDKEKAWCAGRRGSLAITVANDCAGIGN